MTAHHILEDASAILKLYKEMLPTLDVDACRLLPESEFVNLLLTVRQVLIEKAESPVWQWLPHLDDLDKEKALEMSVVHLQLLSKWLRQLQGNIGYRNPYPIPEVKLHGYVDCVAQKGNTEVIVYYYGACCDDLVLADAMTGDAGAGQLTALLCATESLLEHTDDDRDLVIHVSLQLAVTCINQIISEQDVNHEDYQRVDIQKMVEIRELLSVRSGSVQVVYETDKAALAPATKAALDFAHKKRQKDDIPT